ncbi:MFS transporter [Bradyrhizobium sp. CCGUVB23]|uniref:MFS transporter n=1 Tax=Bradyrhizobium sp. CCGUVB23 TaxID=2949630 RepID=UPI0020B3F0B9|nr:MFS transporter [Bradyrhizobium sp. CCGUVB23]MCP3460837.1 MFS transporter [Bradyrhizobium sp. CCGUVB23]
MNPTEISPSSRGLPRGYLGLLVGRTVSELGSEVTVLALPLTAITLLGAGPAQTGLLLACGRAPNLVIGLLAGVIVDRLPHQCILLTANLVMAVTLATIPLLASLGWLGMVQLCAATTLVGTAAVIGEVAYLACVPTVVDRALLVRAQSSWQLSRSCVVTVGPFLAGWLVSAFSAPTAILADSASFVLATVLLPLVPKRTAEPPATGSSSVISQIAEGLTTVFGNPILRAVTFATGSFIFCYNAYSAVFLLYLTQHLGLDGWTTGVVLSIGALGGIGGAATAAWAGRAIGVGPVLMVTLALSGAGMTLAALLTQQRPAAVICVALSQFVLSFGQEIYNVHQVSVRYALSPPRVLGRVNGSIRSLVWGLAPLGALLGGAVGAGPGLRTALVASSALGAASMLWIWRSPLRRTHSLHL